MWPKNSNNNEDKLYLFIIISLIIHLSLFYFLPLGELIDAASEEGKGEKDFGFVQYVELQPSPEQKSEVTESESENTETEEAEEETADSDTEEPEEETDASEMEEELEQPEEEIAENFIEENQEVNIEEENEINEELEEPEETEELEETQDQSNEESGDEQDMLASEESESEVEVEEENNQNNTEENEEDSEEQNEEPEEEESEEEESEETEEEQQEQEEEEDDSSESDETEEEPPPPPTAGELIGISRPYYPKDLVAEGQTGTVTLKAEINENGNLRSLDVSESSGIDNMDEVALRTIENDWSFESYNEGYSVEIIVSFEMNDEGDSSVEVDFENLTFN